MAAELKYEEFLSSKLVKVKPVGIDIPEHEINRYLFNWQRMIVSWALKLGRAALFEDTGLGKTLQQIEWARHICRETKGRILICCPLAVAHQTVCEGKKIGVDIQYVRSMAAVEHSKYQIFITNYDMLPAFDPSAFIGVVLDESSILKNYTGATKRMILEMFTGMRFKLACTATPAPNDHLELGNHAEFLEVMPSNDMISRWFINDSMRAGGYKLKEHARADYWKWVCSWAVCISKPSDIGFADNGFILPPLNIIKQEVAIPMERGRELGKLFYDAPLSATGLWKEKKATAIDRCTAAKNIIDQSEDAWVIWCDTNDEADMLKRLLPSAIEVRGSDSIANKEKRLNAFSDGTAKQIITKSEIAGFGLNWQHCHNMVFVGVSYSFEKLYQALRRSWRYGQRHSVDAHIIYAESEGDIMSTLAEKQAKHAEMQVEMNSAMKANGWSQSGIKAATGITVQSDYIEGKGWQLYLGDAVQEIDKIADDSLHLSVYSPPFSNLYIYSNSIADMGNSKDSVEFFKHYRFLIGKLFRKTMPGRLTVVHCKDLPLYRNRDGAAGLWDFPGMIIRQYERHGWIYHSRVTIWKDPVIEMQRTKNHGLLYKNLRLRGEVTRQGMADYILVFRRWEGVEGTESDIPIRHSRDDFPLSKWQKWASPVWDDIDQTNVLNFRLAREEKDEKHICPLQLDVIERCIELWSNPGEIVLDPFSGIGSTGFIALNMGRKYIGIELKRKYWEISQRYLIEAESKRQGDLFSNIEELEPRGPEI